MEAIRTQALDAIWRSERLIQLRETYHRRLKENGAPSRLFEIVDELFSIPAANMNDIVMRCSVSKPTANNDLMRLEQLRIIDEYTGRARDRDWFAREIIDVIEQNSPRQ